MLTLNTTKTKAMIWDVDKDDDDDGDAEGDGYVDGGSRGERVKMGEVIEGWVEC